jgi:putative membrane protein
MMPGYGWGGCCGLGGFGGLGWIGWTINIVLTVGILIGLVLLVIWAVRRMTNNQSGSLFSSGQGGRGMITAREILQARYARGEITREEYLQMLEDIR